VRFDQVQGGRCFWFNAYTKRRCFGKRGNPNLSQNGVVLVRALNLFFFLLGGYFCNFDLSKRRSLDVSIHFHSNN
jgi:hypothetical protein